LIKELASLDQVVQLYDEKINTSSITPINGWQGNYGKRGALKGFLVETLRSRTPEYVRTDELELLTVSYFSLVFGHPDDRKHWYAGSFRSTLKLLAKQGLVERSHDPKASTRFVGGWRWKQEVAPTLAELPSL
jgi:hypothetical protein